MRYEEPRSFRHYKKGTHYIALGVALPARDIDLTNYRNIQAKHSETLEFIDVYAIDNVFYIVDDQRYVIYHNVDSPNELWAREETMFFEKVMHKGELVLRFEPF